MRRFWVWYDTKRLNGLQLLLLFLFVTVRIDAINHGSYEMPYLLPGIAVSVFEQAVGQNVMPRITSVKPASGKVGAELTALGENLDKAHVAELYLTDDTTDFKAVITDQIATAIKFKIPSEVKPGRYGLMTFTKRIPQSLEVIQPVRVTVEAGARESK